MHPKTLFRVLIKVLGLSLLTLGMIRLIPELVHLVIMDSGTRIAIPRSFQISQWVQTACYLVVGLYLVLGGGWLVNALIRTGIHSCPHCGYQLDARQVRCPECGANTPSARADSDDLSSVDST